MEKFPTPATYQEKQPEGGQSLLRNMESAKQEVQAAIRSGNIKSALDTFLRLRENLPGINRGHEFDYAGEFAKDIMQRSIRSLKQEGASREDINSIVNGYISLREYFPTSNRGHEFDYAGEFAKDIIQKTILAVKKEGIGDANLAKEVLDKLRPYLPTESRGKEFDYAGYYEENIKRL